ncbi:hypothetical protein [Streptomyces tremellae]|uniref:Uncharacterized protein n=1 Tax=Streptomyces tremellae TaxID=1124239 RepID=A0ABP7GE46_9ACTN
MAQSVEASTPSWHEIAQLTDQRRAQWERGTARTYWAACGLTWDAVVVAPIPRALDALDALELDPRRGYPVLADYLRNRLYILVPAGTSRAVEGIDRCRALTRGAHLLLPERGHGTPSSCWLSPLRADSPLIPADSLARHLRSPHPTDRPEERP